jgi:hypothetical protein
MAELHPYEAVYFNSLVGGVDGAEGRYPLDYWGLSYKEGLSYLLRSTHGRVRLWTCTAPGYSNRNLFSRRERERLSYVSKRTASYAVCTGRIARYAWLRRYPTIYSVRRDGGTVLYVKALRAGSVAGAQKRG